MPKVKNVAILGAGRIGTTLAEIFSADKNYHITLLDTVKPKLGINHKNILFELCDINNTSKFTEIIKNENIAAIISCLPYFFNVEIATVAKENNCHYFDLTEDIHITEKIFELAKGANTAFIPQCGIAPGFINIIANHLISEKIQVISEEIQKAPKVDSVKLFCGALPQAYDNALKYALNWSTDGLINEYGNNCRILRNQKIKSVPALTEIESLSIQNINLEAFNTSGGIGTLVDTYENHVKNMVYKTLRYPGHYDKMRFLMNDLNLNHHRKILKEILENALPKNTTDFVITHVEVDNLSDSRIFYPTKIGTLSCSAIQAVTATSAAVIVDIVLSEPTNFFGPIKQEDFSLQNVLNNQFSGYLMS